VVNKEEGERVGGSSSLYETREVCVVGVCVCVCGWKREREEWKAGGKQLKRGPTREKTGPGRRRFGGRSKAGGGGQAQTLQVGTGGSGQECLARQDVVGRKQEKMGLTAQVLGKRANESVRTACGGGPAEFCH
jgi:hypothetical protein